jgi:hypothetical protein
VSFGNLSVLAAVALLALAADAISGSKKASAPASAGNVWVSRPDGTLQCDPKVEGTKDDPMVKARAELEGVGVHVLEAKKRNDGRMHAAACGIATGNETSFRIEKSDLGKAQARGFVSFD